MAGRPRAGAHQAQYENYEVLQLEYQVRRALSLDLWHSFITVSGSGSVQSVTSHGIWCWCYYSTNDYKILGAKF
jgi:hypothetical protein